MRELLEGYARRHERIMVGLLVVWALVSYGAAIFSPALNQVKFLGFPLGYYMAAQGSVATFVVLLFINAMMMDKLDQEYARKLSQDRQVS